MSRKPWVGSSKGLQRPSASLGLGLGLGSFGRRQSGSGRTQILGKSSGTDGSATADPFSGLALLPPAGMRLMLPCSFLLNF